MLEHVQTDAIIIRLEPKSSAHVLGLRLMVQVPDSETLNIVNLLDQVWVDSAFSRGRVHGIAHDYAHLYFEHVCFDGLQ